MPETRLETSGFPLLLWVREGGEVVAIMVLAAEAMGLGGSGGGNGESVLYEIVDARFTGGGLSAAGS